MLQPFQNPDILNLVVKDKINGWHQHAEKSNQARLWWALRFINLFNNRPDYSPKLATNAAYTRHPVRG